MDSLPDILTELKNANKRDDVLAKDLATLVAMA
jgi:hypothetical protein